VIDADFQRLLALLPSLSPLQLAALDAALRPQIGASVASLSTVPAATIATGAEPAKPTACPSIDVIEATFQAAPQCPHCRSTAIKKWGSANGLRRYRCKGCKVTFNALTGTPLAQLHKRELWGAHGQALIDGISLRKVAKRIGVDLTTSFRWRHRFLRAPQALKAQKLEGTVEADETCFLYSQKGSRDLDRPARKRGGKASKRGLSAEQVPVLIARDRNKATTDQVLRDRSEAAITEVLGPIVSSDAILVSDGAHAYRAFADKAKILHVELTVSKGEYTWGIYHIQNVNAYTSRLKGWMRKFNGVATKNLGTYLGWHRIDDREGHTLTASRMLVAAMG